MAETRYRVLLVEDDEISRESIKKVLSQEGFLVFCLADGLAAQELLQGESFHIILSDVQMGATVNSGIELLHYAKRMTNSPVVLMAEFSEVMDESEAMRLGAAGFLTKPIHAEMLIQVVFKICQIENEKIEQEQRLEDQYCKLSIDDFIFGNKFSFGLYIKLSKNKFIKVANAAEDISEERIQSLKQKGIRYLYLEKDDFYSYLKMTLCLGKVLRTEKNIKQEKVLNLMKHTTELFFEQTCFQELDQNLILDAKGIAENAVFFLAQQEKTLDIIYSLNSHCNFLYAHSLGVSLYSVIIARQVGWKSQETLYKVALAGLLHDVGFKEIDADILNKERRSLTPEELKIYESHPTKGASILSKIASIPSDLVQAVLHHHEREGGVGYPQQLSKAMTHPVARLVAVADEFCSLVVKNPNSPGISPKEALSRLMDTQSNLLSLEFLSALSEAFTINRHFLSSQSMAGPIQ